MTDSVGPTPGFHVDPFMTAVGYTIIAVLAIVFLPLLPLAAIVWLMGGPRAAPEVEPS